MVEQIVSFRTELQMDSIFDWKLLEYGGVDVCEAWTASLTGCSTERGGVRLTHLRGHRRI
jgi:hypothetical protein